MPNDAFDGLVFGHFVWGRIHRQTLGFRTVRAHEKSCEGQRHRLRQQGTHDNCLLLQHCQKLQHQAADLCRFRSDQVKRIFGKIHYGCSQTNQRCLKSERERTFDGGQYDACCFCGDGTFARRFSRLWYRQ